MIDRSLGTLLNEIKNTCCRISRKRPPRLSSQGGRVREEVAYESIDDIGSNVCFISMWALQRLDPCFHLDIFFMKKVNFVKIWYFLELGFFFSELMSLP